MAAELSIIARLQDDASSGIRSLRGEVEGLGESGNIASRGFENLQSVGTVALKALAVAAVAAGAAAALFVKSAIQAGIEFESAFAGVVKTVDGVADASGVLTELGQRLRDEFRQLALEIPIAVNELARIGELGGQLGVAADDLIAFTALIAKLGVTTNLSTEEAAMSFARLGNIMQSSQDDLTRLGSAVVYLGNNFATTEADIVEFAGRIAGAGAIAGMTEADLAGIAAAFSSVGVQAEAGGTAVQKVILDMNTAVVTGGSQLELYARTANMTAQQFAEAWRGDAAGAFIEFVEGLGRAGDEAILILQELELNDARLTRGFLSVAQAGDLLRRAIEGSNQAFAENMALSREAALRFQTVESQMQLFRNVINDVKISLYDALRPAIAAVISALTVLVTDAAPKAREVFMAIGAAVSQFVTALLAGETPIKALLDAVFLLAAGLGAPVGQLEELRARLDAFLSAVGNVLGPIAAAVTSFFSWKDVLLAVAIAIASVVIPALVGIVAAVAPVIAVFAGLVLAIAFLRNAWESNFLGIRTAVEGFMSVLGDLVNYIRIVVSDGDVLNDWLTHLPPAFQGIAQSIGGFIVDLQSLVNYIRIVVSDGDVLNDWLTHLPPAFQGIAQAIGGFIVNLQSLVNYIRIVVSDGDLLNDWLTHLPPAWQSLASMIGNVITAFQSFVQTLRDGGSVLDAFRAALPSLGEAARSAGQAIVEGLGAAVTNAKAALIEGFNNLKTAIFDWAGATNWSEVGLKILQMIAETFRNIGSAVADIEAGLFNWIAGAIDGIDWRSVGEAIINGIAAAVSAVVGLLVAAGTAIVNYFIGFFTNDEIKPAAENLIRALGDAIGELAEGIGDGLANIRDAIFDWAEAEDWTGVAEHIIEMVGEGLADAAEAIGDNLESWRDAIFDWADAEDWTGVAEHIIEMIGEGLADAADAIGDNLESWRDEIFDWADAEDWTGVAEHIVEMIGEGLADAAESIWTGLESLEQAFFDWAGAEDWTGVAQHIVEMIGDGLADAAESIWTGLESLEQAFFDWAGAESWSEIGITIVGFIIDGLTSLAENLSDTVSGWFSSFEDAIGSVDWYQLGFDIVTFIIEGLSDIGDSISETVGGWLESFKTTTEGMTWSEIGVLILGAVIVGLSEFGEKVTEVVSAWYTALSGKITEMLASFTGLGVNIVNGIISGIRSMGAAVGEAIRGIIAGALSAGRAEAGAQSPATRFMPLGRDISAGIAVGVTQGAGMIVSAIRNVASLAELEAVKAFSEAFKAVGEAIESAVRSFVLLTGFGGADTGVAATGLASIAAFMSAMVDAFVDANRHAAEALELVGDFADAAGSLVELIADSLLPLRILSAIDTSFLRSGELAVGLESLRNFLVALVGSFLEAAGELGVLGSIVESFADAAESVVGLVEDALRAAAMLSGFNFDAAVQGRHLAEQIVTFRNIVRTLVREFAEAALEFAYMAEAVEDFAGAAESVIDLVEDALRATMMLSGFNFDAAVQGWRLAEQIETFRNIVRTMVREFAEAALEFSYMGEAVEDFAGAAESVIDLVEDGLAAVLMLSGFNFGAAVQGWHLRDQIVIFRNIVRTMVREFAEAALEFGAMAESVEAFADAAEGVIGLVEDGLAAAVMLSRIDFGPIVSGWHLAEQIEIFRNIIRTLVREFAEAAAEFGYMAESVEDFADAAEGVVGLVEDGIAAVTVLSAVDFGPIVSGWHLAEQIEIFRNIIRTLVREFAEAAAEFGTMSESVENFADAAGAVVDLIGPAIESMELLVAFEPIAGIREKATAFGLQLTATLAEIANAFAQVSDDARAAIASAEEFTEHAEAILDVVEPGLEALAALAGYQALPGIRVNATAFALQLVAVLSEIAAAFAAASAEAKAAIIEAASFSESAGAILDVVEPGLEALAGLADYVSASGIRVRTQAFSADLIMVISTLADGMQAAGLAANQAVVEAAELSDKLTQILDLIQPGIEALAALADYTSAANINEKTQRFTSDLIMVTQSLVQGLTQSALASGEALTKAVQMSQAIMQLFDVIKPAIEALATLADYTSSANLVPKAQQFTNDLVSVATVLVNGLTAAANAIGGAAIASAQAFAAAALEIIAAIKSALETLAELANVPTVSIQPKLDYLVQTGNQIVAAGQQLGAVTGAIQQMATFRENIAQFVDEVLGALAELERLMAANAPGSVQDILNKMLAAFQNQAGAFTGAGAQIANNVMDGWKAAAWDEAGRQAVLSLAAGIAGAGSALVGVINALIVTVLNAARSAIDGFGDIGRDAVDAFAAGMAAGGGAVSASAAKVVQDAINAARNAAAGAVEIGNAIVDAIIRGIQSGTGAVVQAIINLVNAAITAGRNAAAGAGALGAAIISAISSGLNSGGSAVGSAMSNVIYSAISAGMAAARGASAIGSAMIQAANSELVGGRGLLDSSGAATGQAVVNGFVRSIVAGRDSVINAVRNLMNAAAAAARNTLEVASPSRVFMELADQSVQGYVQNLLRGARAVAEASSVVMRGAINPAMPPFVGLGTPVPAITGSVGAPRRFAATNVQSGDVNVTIHIDGGNHDTAEIRRQVEKAVSDALMSQGRRADAMRRLG